MACSPVERQSTQSPMCSLVPEEPDNSIAESTVVDAYDEANGMYMEAETPPIISLKKRRQFEDTFKKALRRGIKSMIKEILLHIPDPLIWDDITKTLTTILKNSQAKDARP